MKKTVTGTDKLKLCYLGDLPDRRVDGITLSFQRNLTILSESFEIISSPEKARLGTSVLKRIFAVPFFLLRSYFFIRKHSPDIIYINLPSSKNGIQKISQLVSLCQKDQQKWILHVHRGDFLQNIQSNENIKNSIQNLLKKVNTLIVLSSKEAAELNKVFFCKKFVALANSVNRIQSNDDISTSKNYYLFLSNYLETKGIFNLLKAFQNIESDSTLQCYGAFPSDTIKNKIESFNSDRIKIYGPVFDEKKYKIMNEARCLILPSYSEGQPLVLLEAMSIGLPIIAFDVGHIQELLGEDYPLLVIPKNPDSLRKAILKFEKSDDAIIGAQLKDRFDNEYSPERHRTNLLNIFCSLVA